jgi:hypothetical protein
MQSHTFSTVLYDVSWTQIGDAVDAVKKLDSTDSIQLRVTHDTSGGERDDGAAYQTETVLSVEYEYQLGEGQVALDDFGKKLSQVPALSSDAATLKTDIKQRG